MFKMNIKIKHYIFYMYLKRGMHKIQAPVHKDD